MASAARPLRRCESLEAWPAWGIEQSRPRRYRTLATGRTARISGLSNRWRWPESGLYSIYYGFMWVVRIRFASVARLNLNTCTSGDSDSRIARFEINIGQAQLNSRYLQSGLEFW